MNNGRRAWNVRDTIISPLIANILTGAVVFFAVFFLKEPIYDFFKHKQYLDTYPIYCVVEPYTDDDGTVSIDLFVINLEHESYDTRRLVNFVLPSEKDSNIFLDPTRIRLLWKETFSPGKITAVTLDTDFNNNKGILVVEPPAKEQNYWSIFVKEITPKAVLKAKIKTDIEHQGIKRDMKTLVPFETVYLGS